MRFLLLQWGFADLGVSEHAHDGAVFLDAFQFAGDRRWGFSVLFSVFGEGFFLGFVPVFVEAAFYFVGEMLGPNGCEGAEAARGFDVADEADDDHLDPFVNYPFRIKVLVVEHMGIREGFQ